MHNQINKEHKYVNRVKKVVQGGERKVQDVVEVDEVKRTKDFKGDH